MATLPRSSGKSALLTRPNTQDFDSGINSSAAWTESNNPSVSLLRPRKYLSESNLRQNGSLSDDELDDGLGEQNPAQVVVRLDSLVELVVVV